MAKNHKHSVLKPDSTTFGRILLLIGIFGVLIFLIMFLKLYQLQIVQGDELGMEAADQQIHEETAYASRGTIYDANGNILAISATTYNVFISPHEINRDKNDGELIAQKLSELLKVDADSIRQQLTNTESWYEMVKKGVDADTAELISQFKSENKINGIHFETSSTRYYPNNSLACHVLGYVGDEGTGLAGIEYKYNDYLQGTDGNIINITTRDGTSLTYAQSSAVDGNDLTLTIDSTIQKIAEGYLNQAVIDYNVENGGCVIVQDVNSGAILAMASNGYFDPNDYQKISDDLLAEISLIADEEERNNAIAEARYTMWRNKALADSYEPGSVFKTITLAMALEEGVTDESHWYECNGSMRVLGRETDLHCSNRSGHGWLSLSEAVQQSCNIAFTNIGLEIGAETFYKYCEAFGFFDKTGIDLNGEGNDIWWSEDVFYNKNNLSQLAVASWGQTFGITPIQMITALSASVNGGYLMKPYIVESITDENGAAVYQHEATVVRQAVSNETSAEVRKLLEEVVSEEGATGHRAYIEGYRIGGKTGTSEKIGTISEDGEEKDYLVSFGGFAPADNPQIAVLFILDTPSEETGTGVGGGTMAAAVTAQIIKETLDHLGYQPE